MNSNVENITQKILDDAKLQTQEIEKEAKAEYESIMNDYKNQADILEANFEKNAKSNIAHINERIVSKVALTKRNMYLATKREVIDSAFVKAKELLTSLPEDKYIELLSSLVVKYISSDAKIVLNKKDNAEVGSKLVDKISKKLNDNKKSFKVSISPKIGNFAGGVILVEGNIESNFTFDVMINSAHDSLEADVAKILFN